MDIKKDHINFAVGPVQISEEISRIGADPVPYFRTPDFSALMKENEALLKEFMDAPEDARAVFLTGSGTASMDAVTQNVFTKDDRLLVVAGGSFGHRFCEICEVYGIPHTAIELRQGHALTPADLAPVLDRLDQRHGEDITLLLQAVASGNIEAVDALLDEAVEEEAAQIAASLPQELEELRARLNRRSSDRSGL